MAPTVTMRTTAIRSAGAARMGLVGRGLARCYSRHDPMLEQYASRLERIATLENAIIHRFSPDVYIVELRGYYDSTVAHVIETMIRGAPGFAEPHGRIIVIDENFMSPEDDVTYTGEIPGRCDVMFARR